jgi:MFS family permease
LHKTFWTRDFALALLGYFMLFLSVTLFYLYPLYFEDLNVSRSQVGLIMGIHSLTAIMVRPFFGRLVDERGGRSMALAGILLMIFCIPWFHLVRDAGALPVVLRALTGAGWGIGMTATIAICSDLAPLDRLAHSIGIIGVAGIVAAAIGPMVAEEIIRNFGFPRVFDASLALLIGSLVCMILTKRIPRRDKIHGPGGRIRLRDFPVLTLMVIAMMCVSHGAVRGAVVNFIALFASDAGFGRVGPFFLIFSAAAVLTRLGFGDLSDRYGRKKIIFPSALLISLNLFWISTIHSYEVFIISGLVAGLGQGLIFPALSTYIIDKLGRDNKGLALGLYLALFDAGMGLGSPFFGWISDMAGYRVMYAVAALLLLLANLSFTWGSDQAK